MSNDIRIKKGLDIKLVGEAALTKSDAIKSNFYSIKPEDFHGLTPKLLVKVGEKVKAGEPIFYDKSNASIQFVSPVSGEVVEILRGEKRRILEVKIQADKTQTFFDQFYRQAHQKTGASIFDSRSIKINRGPCRG